jgi:methionyl-tRNA synthetase
MPPMASERRILVTSALPYANGHIHIGHLVEYTQTDIWVRFQRLQGHECRYVCADDTHGTAIMIRAQQEGRSERELIAAMSEAHQRDFAAFDIMFDHYGSTDSPVNRELCEEIWQTLCRQGYVVERDVAQLYDPEAGLFLADRYVVGQCPRCGTADQNGDSCNNCGATYTPSDLIEPKSTLSGARPETRSAKHWFIVIERLHDFLASWTQSGEHLQAGVANYLKGHFLGEPLRDWDVSRPAPYFGFEIPGAAGNYWYVWFDAPIGYMAATREWCDRHAANFDDYWRSPQTEIHHFIGKDIVYFHTLFWPAVLKACGFNLPERIHVHGMLTVNGTKMSKSRGTFITASQYLEQLESGYLRYYYATKLTGKVEDLDFDTEEFVNRVNADLVGKVVNLASRTARFIEKLGLSASYPGDDQGLFKLGMDQATPIAEAYESCDYNRATRLIMSLADRANEYVDQQQPWALAKDPARATQLQDVCTVALNVFRQICIYLAPVLPRLADAAGELFGEKLDSWAASQSPVMGKRLAPFKHLIQRVDAKKVRALLQSAAGVGEGRPATSGAETPAATPVVPARRDHEPLAAECSIEDFQKLDLRVGKVLEAHEVPEAKKLIRLLVDVGESRRTVFAGIKSSYRPAELVGKLVVVLANLEPRSMKFGVSEGMLLASSASPSEGREQIFLLSLDRDAEVGQRIR